MNGGASSSLRLSKAHRASILRFRKRRAMVECREETAHILRAYLSRPAQVPPQAPAPWYRRLLGLGKTTIIVGY